MNRTEVIQRIVDKLGARAYLEIGVKDGSNFFPIRAKRKIAVDPQFTFSKSRRLRWAVKNFHNIVARFYRLESDQYFAAKGPDPRLDVVFVDGLHTYQQSLRDVLHALDHLDERGVIVMHDCNPTHPATAWPANSLADVTALHIPGWNGAWCGDVWKTVCYLRSQRQDLRVFVLDCDYGMGIVTRGTPESSLPLTEADIDQMSYDDLARNRSELLNLKEETFLSDFLKSL